MRRAPEALEAFQELPADQHGDLKGRLRETRGSEAVRSIIRSPGSVVTVVRAVFAWWYTLESWSEATTDDLLEIAVEELTAGRAKR